MKSDRASCRELWAQTPHASHPGAIADAWAEEVRHLMQPSRPFNGFVEYAKRVSPACWSIWTAIATACRPPSPIVQSAYGVYPERIVVAAEGQVVCEHRRVFARFHQQKSTTTFPLSPRQSPVQAPSTGTLGLGKGRGLFWVMHFGPL